MDPTDRAAHGLETFGGALYHTGAWPHNGVDFSGKRVAQLGTGATGIQVAPVVAEQAEELYILQRTANFSVPAGQRPLDPVARETFVEKFAEKREEALNAPSGMAYVPVPDRPARAFSADDRKRILEERWQNGGSFAFSSSFSDILTNRAANNVMAEFVQDKIRSIVKDPVTADSLCPTDHPYASKRVCVDTGYFATFNRDNVQLVDLKKEALVAVTETGFRTSSATYDVDAIIFATGFDAISGAILSMDVRGRDGLRLRDAWKDGPKAYLGLQVAGFPNLFLITGPGSPSVKANMFKSIEQHVDWVADCIADMEAKGYTTIEADTKAQDEWAAAVTELADDTLYPEANSWWIGANVPGKPRSFAIYIGGFAKFRQICFDVRREGYRGFTLLSAEANSTS